MISLAAKMAPATKIGARSADSLPRLETSRPIIPQEESRVRSTEHAPDPVRSIRLRANPARPYPSRFRLPGPDLDLALLPEFKQPRLHLYSPSSTSYASSYGEPLTVEFPWHKPIFSPSPRPQPKLTLTQYSPFRQDTRGYRIREERDSLYDSAILKAHWKEPDIISSLIKQDPEPEPIRLHTLDLPHLDFVAPKHVGESGSLRLPDVELWLPNQDALTIKLPKIDLIHHDDLPRSTSGYLTPAPGREPGPALSDSFFRGLPHVSGGAAVSQYYLAGLSSSQSIQNINLPLSYQMQAPLVQPFAPISINPMGSPPPMTAAWGFA